MREILFRGKQVDNGEWVEGYFVYAKSDFDDETLRWADIIPHDTDRVYKGEYNVVYPCIPETVGQYTGLTDKNGKRIFEWDIVKIYLYEPKGLANFEIGCIRYDDTKVRFVFCNEGGNYSLDNTNVYEIIGNIHDNPELLKGGAEE